MNAGSCQKGCPKISNGSPSPVARRPAIGEAEELLRWIPSRMRRLEGGGQDGESLVWS